MPSYRALNAPPQSNPKPRTSARNAFELPRPAKLATVKRQGSGSSHELKSDTEARGPTPTTMRGRGSAPRKRSPSLSRKWHTSTASSTAAAASNSSESGHSNDEDVFEDALSSPVETFPSDAGHPSESGGQDAPTDCTKQQNQIPADIPQRPSPVDEGRFSCQEPVPEAPLPVFCSVSQTMVNGQNRRHSQYARIHQRPLPIPPHSPVRPARLRPLPDPLAYANTDRAPALLAAQSRGTEAPSEQDSRVAHEPSALASELAVPSSPPHRSDGPTTRRGNLRIDLVAIGSEDGERAGRMSTRNEADCQHRDLPRTPFPREPLPQRGVRKGAFRHEGESDKSRRHPVGRATRPRRQAEEEKGVRTVMIDTPRPTVNSEIMHEPTHGDGLNCLGATNKLRSKAVKAVAGTGDGKSQDDGSARRRARRTRSLRELVTPCIPKESWSFD